MVVVDEEEPEAEEIIDPDQEDETPLPLALSEPRREKRAVVVDWD